MKIFIFEGIATSGKSTIIQHLKSSLGSLRHSIVGEDETHIPIMNEPYDTHVDFFIYLLEQKLASNLDVVIFDRLYLTQAFRSDSSIDAYKQVEDLLLRHEVLTVFLKVNADTIADRVCKASRHREPDWADYIKTKGQSIEEIANYYSVQQSGLLELLESSTIPYKVFDTTAHNYQQIADELVMLAGRG
jgi:thymidylate kinase